MSDESNASAATPSGSQAGQTQQILSAFFEEEKSATQPEQADRQAEATDAEAAPTDATGETPDDADGASEQTEYTLAELAESLEIDPEDLYAAQVAMQDGTRIPVGKIKDAWTEAQAALTKTEQAKQQVEAQRQQFESQQAAFQSQQQMAELARPDQDEMKLHSDWDALNRAENDRAYWDQATAQDAGQAAMALQRVQQARRDLEKQIDAKVGERRLKAQQLAGQYRQQAVAEVQKRIPGWTSQEAYQRDWREISTTMSGYGLTQPQIDTLWNQPALLHLMRDHVELLRKVKPADPKKKVVLPKSLRSGARRSEQSVNKAKMDGIMQEAKTGDRKAQIAAVKALIGG